MWLLLALLPICERCKQRGSFHHFIQREERTTDNETGTQTDEIKLTAAIDVRSNAYLFIDEALGKHSKRPLVKLMTHGYPFMSREKLDNKLFYT